MNKKRILIISLISLLSMIFVVTLSNILSATDKKNTKLSKGWEISYHNETYKDVELLSHKFHKLVTGDIITLKYNLKNVPKLEEPILDFTTSRSGIEVYLDDKKIYDMNMDRLENHLFTGAGCNRASLPPGYNSKMLTIKLYINTDSPFTYLNPISIGDARKIYQAFFLKTSPYIVMGFIEIFVGIICICISIFLIRKYKDFYEILYTGILSNVSGIWILAGSKVLQAFLKGFTIHSFIEYIALYSLPCWNALIYYYIFKNNEKKRKMLKILSIINFSFITITLLLQIFRIAVLQKFLFVFHGIMAVELIYVFITLCTVSADKEKFKNYITDGLILLSFFSLYDILKYDILKFFELNKIVHNIIFFPVGMTLYITELIIAYATIMEEKISSAKEKKKLDGLAYIDFLTNLYNRTKCELLFDELDTSNTNYYIVSIDLNDLKKLNDSKGHSYGDYYLSRFASLLQTFFKKYGYCGRMGGDEFIIFIPFKNKLKIENIMKSFEERIKIINKKTKDLKLRFAYGYASNTQAKSSRLVYGIADERMYEQKQRMKKLK